LDLNLGAAKLLNKNFSSQSLNNNDSGISDSIFFANPDFGRNVISVPVTEIFEPKKLGQKYSVRSNSKFFSGHGVGWLSDAQ